MNKICKKWTLQIIEELNEPSKDSDIHAEIVDFMLKRLMEKYSFIDNEGSIIKYK